MSEIILNDPKIDCYHIVDLLNINEGDCILVSSSLSRLFHLEKEYRGVKPDIHQFIESFTNKITENGTLLFPTYNWGFCRGETYDYLKTPAETGALANEALKHPGFKRTKHPIYSFAVWGKGQEELCRLENISSFGADSPFGYLHKHHGKNLVIDVSLTHSFTFVHYVEELTKFPHYRYHKFFNADYIDEFGNKSHREYSMLVRDLDLEVTNVLEPIEQEFIDTDVTQKTIINGIPFSLINLCASAEAIKKDIYHNRSRKICTYKGQYDD